ncbi:MAG: ADP-ribose-binding protein [Desulfuromonas sp.]|uniref:ADP-ribose-binding protein n=1 Tax=Desulfuromonas sp. TaxID=892 RepID=UPI000CAFB210|nr:ADP-ribose-binding protein [Desulfuromonas sp.]PLX86678.1 MAG: ADP-ribose-binding protein [Desulfuromonas sp.]
MSSGGTIEIRGELWDHLGRAILAITTCGRVSKRGEAVMLRGCARQARDRFPGLAQRFGALILSGGNHVYDMGDGMVSFPVEDDPFGIAEPRLIEQSCRELVSLANQKGWKRIVVPRPGCGGGGLEWAQVRPILERHFDERFLVISAR